MGRLRMPFGAPLLRNGARHAAFLSRTATASAAASMLVLLLPQLLLLLLLLLLLFFDDYLL